MHHKRAMIDGDDVPAQDYGLRRDALHNVHGTAKRFVDRARKVRRKIKDYVASRLVERWDAIHRVDTNGRLPHVSSNTELSGDHASSAYDIVSTPPRVFAHIARYFPTSLADYTFLDIGSGKGRTVILASELGFKISIGVEISKFACDVASTNLGRYVSPVPNRSPCVFFNTSATELAFPDGKLVVFFNNPFSLDIWPTMVRILSDVASGGETVTVILIGSFPDTIQAAAKLFEQSAVFRIRAEGLTPHFWDSYAPFYFIIIDASRAEPNVSRC